MKKVVRTVARSLLWVVTGAVPFVIAACYGMEYRYERAGRVIDAVTRAGIAGIRASCIVGGETQYSDLSMDGGDVYVRYNDPCDSVLFEDIDGTANGSYPSRSIPLPGADGFVVELTPQP